MIYVTYELYKAKYYEAQKQYNEILSEKEKLFALTQPKATTYDKEKVNGGTPNNAFDTYLILKENKQIDQKLEEIKSILEDRENLVKLKEDELRNSKILIDKVYRYRYLDKLRVHKIGKLVGYSEAQVYRILRTIKNNLK